MASIPDKVDSRAVRLQTLTKSRFDHVLSGPVPSPTAYLYPVISFSEARNNLQGTKFLPFAHPDRLLTAGIREHEGMDTIFAPSPSILSLMLDFIVGRKPPGKVPSVSIASCQYSHMNSSHEILHTPSSVCYE